MTPPCKVGDRVRLTGPIHDEHPPPGLPTGLEGTVRWMGQWTAPITHQIGVVWDNGRCLNLLAGDPFEIITTTREEAS